MKQVYRIRQPWQSWTDRFRVFDESGEELLYRVRTTSFWTGGNLTVEDANGVERLKSVREG